MQAKTNKINNYNGKTMYKHILSALVLIEIEIYEEPTLQGRVVNTSFDFTYRASLIKPFEKTLPEDAVALNKENKISPDFVENISHNLFSYNIVESSKTEMSCLVEIKMMPILYCDNIEYLENFTSQALTVFIKNLSVNVIVPKLSPEHETKQSNNKINMQ
jgi:hypothetical protein